MNLSEGQNVALKQLKRIAETPLSALRIDHVEDKGVSEIPLIVDVSIDCTRYERANGGLALHDRECVRLSIPADFPFALPIISTAHTRFHGFHHVQWGNQLCIYLSLEAQWEPSDGMTGLIGQLDRWFRKAAINELDDPGGPIHPPVAYIAASTTVYVNENTPGPDDWPWYGAAIIKELKPNLISISDWRQVGGIGAETPFAPALLLDFELSFEYPRFVRTLFDWFEFKGMDCSKLIFYLLLAARRLPDGEPMRIVIGAPSRGIAGDNNSRQQHLSVWEVSADDTKKLRLTALAFGALVKFEDTDAAEAIEKLVEPIIDEFFKWKNESRIGWCRVVENREEIVVRRDLGSDMDWFKEKSIAIWGCGALGSQIAEHLVRAGVKKLILVDSGRVNPGILVRQNFVLSDLNDCKVAALERRLVEINDQVEIKTQYVNVISDVLCDMDWQQDVDLLIDATASLRVRTKLEKVLKGSNRDLPIGSLLLSAAARHALMTLSPPAYSGGPLDVLRKVGLAAKNRDWMNDWVEAFWDPDGDEQARQPEPGCSDPTFVGSNVDVAGLVARMLNHLGKELGADPKDALGVLLSQDNQFKKDEVFRFKSDIVLINDSIEFRLAPHAWRDAEAWLNSGSRERSKEDETGGLMFGEFNEVLGIGWITSVSGPPNDSTFSPEGFVCGTERTDELCKEQSSRSLGAVKYIGTWHSHPVSAARPSETDFLGIGELFATNPEQGPYQLMMIVGFAAKSNTEIGIYGFERHELVAHQNEVGLKIGMQGSVIPAPIIKPYGLRIGLALSGGGSRAVAFHLGTLRALSDTGLLDSVDLISGVSGGAVLTGILGYSDAAFNKIDKRTVSFLRKGLVFPALKKFLHPKRFIPTLYNWVFVTWLSVIVDLVAKTLTIGVRILSFGRLKPRIDRYLYWPFQRRYSRTHVVADAIAEVVGNSTCDAPTRNGKDVVFNACELRTGTAFRMSNRRFGGWRVGWAPAKELRIADAIAASAAFPVALPAFDWKKAFTKENKSLSQRILVTDGGVYENIGVSVMEPGSNPKYKVIDYTPQVLLASDASSGQFKGDAIPKYWSSRMIQVVESIMRKVQDATKARLHAYARNGEINAFVYAHLGQIDKNVPVRPSNWISRKTVMEYPTDFSAMKSKDLKALSGRGEAITRALVSRYLLTD